MTNWLNLTDEQKRTSLIQAGINSGIPAKAIEKDWWVTLMLKALFRTQYAKSLIFKGGTSLSKCWKLIERFSEDIDIALDPMVFGMEYNERPGSGYLNRLKRRGCAFTSNELKEALNLELRNLGVADGVVEILAGEIKPEMKDKDPQELYVKYTSLFDPNPYLADEVKIEVSVRSKLEPFTEMPVNSLLNEFFPNDAYSSEPFNIQVVEPHKTFLEKAFLLHEEFYKKDNTKIRTDRMSRHYYDLERMMDTETSNKALTDQPLYTAIILHRSYYNKFKDLDYQLLNTSFIDFYPPEEFIDEYKQDYAVMRENMIHGSSLDPSQLFERIKLLLKRFRDAPN